jgi:hypothetical protein
MFFLICAGVYAQSRNDMLIFIEPTAFGTDAENAFFDENIRMELIAANYTVTDSRENADYTLIPMVADPDPDDPTIKEKRSLILRLMRNSDNAEIVQVGIGYNDVTDTYEWNLYLVYQAMANVPLTKPVDAALPPPLPYNYWRDKMLYLSFAGIYAPQFIINKEDDTWLSTSPTPFTGSVGIEWQFLDSLAIDFKARPDILYYEPKKSSGGGAKYNLAVPITLRYIFKIGDTWMIEPYAGVAINTPLSSGLEIPLITPMAGLEVGSRMGDVGALFFFLEAAYDKEVTYEYTNTRRHTGARIQMLFGVGLKFGFINREINTEIDTETDSEPDEDLIDLEADE